MLVITCAWDDPNTGLVQCQQSTKTGLLYHWQQEATGYTYLMGLVLGVADAGAQERIRLML